MTSPNESPSTAHVFEPRNIVLCSDGTGNQDIKDRGTNVFKLYEAVDIQGHKAVAGAGKAVQQIAFYDDGVGTSKLTGLKILGQAFGWGFARNIQALYKTLCRVYEPGDKLFLFGFSRGAYTIRALAGMITRFGILDREKFASSLEFDTALTDLWSSFEGLAFKDKSHKSCKHPWENSMVSESHTIEFIGVWDTVGAVGAPFKELTWLLNLICPREFVDKTPSRKINRACHALAIDDERLTFHPTLWNEKEAEEPSVISQVWFAGAHSNVGGGYPKQGMSMVSLDWMMTEAEKCGLRFIPSAREYVRTSQDVHDKLYDSRSGAAVYYRWEPRNIQLMCEENGITPKIHVSVLERIAIGTFGYAPGNLPFDFTIVSNQTCPVNSSATQNCNKWPSPNTIEEVENFLKGSNKQYSPLKSLLDRHVGRIRSGKISYYAFLALSIATTLWLWFRSSTSCPCLPIMICGEQWKDCLMSLLPSLGIFGALSALIWSWADGVDKSFAEDFANYWRRIRSDLRRKLL